jgi:uncharacterized protein YdhG (YjbR/CyaY superfamily)
MSEKEVLAYINAQPEPQKSTLEAVRKNILKIEPKLEQVIAWKAPFFKFNGKYVAGMCAFKKHITFFPHGTDVMTVHKEELEGYVTSKSSFQFAVDKPLPKSLLTKLVKARIKEIN